MMMGGGWMIGLSRWYREKMRYREGAKARAIVVAQMERRGDMIESQER
jgi:hypothetical protein